MMTQMLKGKTKADAAKLFEQFHALVTGEADNGDEVGKLAVFAGRQEVSRAREMRHPGLAHAAVRARRQAGSGFDGVGAQGASDRSKVREQGTKGPGKL